MAENKFIAVLLLVTWVLLINACNDQEGKRQKSVFKQVPEIAEIKPEKPVKVKLKRSVNGSYSWEVTGDDTDKVIQANEKLRKAIESKSAIVP